MVTRDEARARFEARFAQADKDNNGQLSAEERARPPREMRGDGERRARRGGGDRMNAARERMMARVDTNGDGKISLAEQRAVATAMFDRVDANHDGSIDQAERDAARTAMRAMHDRRGATPPAAD